jgi:hypothetical protein
MVDGEGTVVIDEDGRGAYSFTVKPWNPVESHKSSANGRTTASTRGGRNLRVLEKYTRQESNLRPGFLASMRKIKTPHIQYRDAHPNTKKYTRQESNLRPGFLASMRKIKSPHI